MIRFRREVLEDFARRALLAESGDDEIGRISSDQGVHLGDQRLDDRHVALAFEIRLFINVEIVIIGGDARRHIDGRAAEGNVRRSDRKPVIRADRLGRIDLDASVFILEIIVLLESHLRNRNVSDLQGRIEFKTRFGKDKRSLDDLARGDRTVVSGSRRVGDPENAGREVVERHLPVNRIGHAVNHATGIDQVHLGSRILSSAIRSSSSHPPRSDRGRRNCWFCGP